MLSLDVMCDEALLHKDLIFVCGGTGKGGSIIMGVEGHNWQQRTYHCGEKKDKDGVTSMLH